MSPENSIGYEEVRTVSFGAAVRGSARRRPPCEAQGRARLEESEGVAQNAPVYGPFRDRTTFWNDSQDYGILPSSFYSNAIKLIGCYTKYIYLLSRYRNGSSAWSRLMGYQPIENYGIIGNMRTAALV